MLFNSDYSLMHLQNLLSIWYLFATQWSKTSYFKRAIMFSFVLLSFVLFYIGYCFSRSFFLFDTITHLQYNGKSFPPLKMVLYCLKRYTNNCIIIHETVIKTLLLCISYATSNQAATPHRDSDSLLQWVSIPPDNSKLNGNICHAV